MSQKYAFSLFHLFTLHLNLCESAITEWTKYVTSTNYVNNKLVQEALNTDVPLYFSKEKYSELTAKMACSRICSSQSECLAFNLYSTATHYVCEHLNDNFCSRRQRLALQAWPGGQVWDKLVPETTSACIDQRFVSEVSTNYCEIGRSGCRSVWPHCNSCVESCRNCSVLYNKTGSYECTLWPEGPYRRPIFGFCEDMSTFLVRRRVFLDARYASPDYRMSLGDMNRLYKLTVYNYLKFTFSSTTGEVYTAMYENFVIDSMGTLSNMTYKAGSGTDGFKTGANPLAPSPFTLNQPIFGINCGPFWFLNSTQGQSANQYCPGGGVNMFGGIFNAFGIQDTGIKWPQATVEGKLLNYTNMKMVV